MKTFLHLELLTAELKLEQFDSYELLVVNGFDFFLPMQVLHRHCSPHAQRPPHHRHTFAVFSITAFHSVIVVKDVLRVCFFLLVGFDPVQDHEDMGFDHDVLKLHGHLVGSVVLVYIGKVRNCLAVQGHDVNHVLFIALLFILVDVPLEFHYTSIKVLR